MSLNLEVFAAIRAIAEVAGDAGGSTRYDLPMTLRLRTLDDGTGDYQAQKMFVDTRSLNASANEDLDLSGALAGPAGLSAVFTKVKGIFIKAAAANVNSVIVKPADENGFLGPFGDASDAIAIGPGDVFMATALKAGWTVTASTGDLLNIANGGAGSAVSYDIVLFGI